MSHLLKLPNTGKVLEKNLLEIGISTPEQLQKMKAEEVFLCIRQQVDEGACLHMLYGIEGAIEGIKDKDLSEEVKTRLKDFFNHLK